MKERIGYFDSAKAILITMVVVGHILNYANPDYSILPYTLVQGFITYMAADQIACHTVFLL